MYKLLVTTTYSQHGLATSVVEYDNKDDAEAAYTILKASGTDQYVRRTVLRLY